MEQDNIRFVLVNTTHPGNIGAAARALKNMGWCELYLVCPKAFPHPEASVRASGADDLLENAKVVKTLDEAIADCHLVVGTSARERALPIPLLSPRECAEKTHAYAMQQYRTALVFGQERMGLTNEELAKCHYHLFIPCNPNFPSLNLAAAIQIVAYELHLIFNHEKSTKGFQRNPVNAEEMEDFYRHLEETLILIEFLNPHQPRQMMKKIRRLFNRVAIERNEMNILRGILAMMNKKVR